LAKSLGLPEQSLYILWLVPQGLIKVVKCVVVSLLRQIGIGQVEMGFGIRRLKLKCPDNELDTNVLLPPLQTNNAPQVQGLGMLRIRYAHLRVQIMSYGQLRQVVRLQRLLKQGGRCVHGAKKIEE
jgi:hypothetical protein